MISVPPAGPGRGRQRLGRFASGLAALAALAVVATPTAAPAHPFALSAFDAYTDGRDVRFEFKLDATSVVDLINRTKRTQPPAPIVAIPAHKDLVLDYFATRFRVTNTDWGCTLHRPDRLMLSETTGKVLLTARFRCPTELGFLVIDSTLFHDELTPHDMVGNFHHLRAFERYFFSKTSREARIDVPGLPQMLPAVIDNRGGFRTATPPNGAFDERLRQAAQGQAGSGSGSAAATGSGWGGFVHFVKQGIVHILGGLDHVLFVVSLIVAIRTRRQLLLVITSFTVAHSLTLLLATLGLVSMSPRLAEPLIALSIVYVAVENLLRPEQPARPKVTFAFGLIHGFGFSSVLRDLGFGGGDLAPLLVGFNLGVEIGQLAVVLPLFPLVLWLRRRPELFARAALGTNVAVGLIACWWFLQRLWA